VNNIEDVTKSSETGNPEGKPEAPEGTKPDDTTGTPTTTQEASPTGEADLKKEVEDLRKAVKGFQPALQRAITERDRSREEAKIYRDQLSNTGMGDAGDTEDGTNPLVLAELARARKVAFDAKAQAAASKLLAGSKLPQALRESIARNPLAHISISDSTDEYTIGFEVEEKLPTYLESLESELGVNKETAKAEVAKVEATALTGGAGSPPPPGGSTGTANTVSSDELGRLQRNPAARTELKEMMKKIDSGELKVVRSK